MKKIIVIPDSFKGTMSSLEVRAISEYELLKHFREDLIVTIPVADGGEGTVECFARIKNADIVSVKTTDAFMRKINALYAVYDRTAVIELASAAGYSLNADEKDPLRSTTYGVGALIKDAVERGCKKIILGLGGSCTNDGGAGIAASLGAEFKDADGRVFVPTGNTLADVRSIDISSVKTLLKGIEIIGMCDTDSIMYGRNGAAFVFSPQKGAGPEEVKFLDHQLFAFSETIKKCLNTDVSRLKGGGAAGAAGAGICAFMGARLQSGAKTILNQVSFKELLDNCAVVITGEGRFDHQSLGGKLLTGISSMSMEKGVPVIIITGKCDKNLKNLSDYGIAAVFETGPFDPSKPISQIRYECREALKRTAGEVCQYISSSVTF